MGHGLVMADTSVAVIAIPLRYQIKVKTTHIITKTHAQTWKPMID